METTEITAGVLHLRPPQNGDAGALFEACQDPEIQRWTQLPSPYHRSDAVDWVSRTVPDGWASGTAAIFLVLDSTTGGLLGSAGLHRIGDGEAEVGYWVAASARRRGVATTAVGAVTRWGFGALGLERIAWLSAVGNTGSWRVAERLGFQFEGTLRKGLLHRGERIDGWIAARLADDPAPAG